MDATCLTFQHRNVKKIKDQVNFNFCSICDWFIADKVSSHQGEDRTSILFKAKFKIKRAESLNIVCGNVKIQRHYSKVTYQGCILD